MGKEKCYPGQIWDNWDGRQNRCCGAQSSPGEYFQGTDKQKIQPEKSVGIVLSLIMINISGPDERPRVEAEASYSSSERGKQSLAAKGAYDLKQEE